MSKCLGIKVGIGLGIRFLRRILDQNEDRKAARDHSDIYS